MEPFTLNVDGNPTSPQPRPIWVKDHLTRFGRKLDPHARKRKWAFLAQSPSAFFQAASPLFWADFARSSLLDNFSGGKKTRLWINGDPVYGLFSSFTDAAGRLVFDLGSFGECVVADYQLDLLRLCVSLVLCAQENHRSPKAAYRMALECARSYWREIKSCRWYGNVRYFPWDEEQAAGPVRHFLADVRKTRGYAQMAGLWAKAGKTGLKFKTNGGKELESLPKEEARKLEKSFLRYAEALKPWPGPKPRVFELADLARRVTATGRDCFWALVRIKEEGENPYRILEAREEARPAGWDELPKKLRKKTRELSGDSQSLRVELGCRALSRTTDPWLGRLEVKEKEFLVREKSPWEAALPGPMLDETAASQFGSILARAHCRAKDSFAKNAFEAIKHDKKAFRGQVAEAAVAYAAQVEADYKSFISNPVD